MSQRLTDSTTRPWSRFGRTPLLATLAVALLVMGAGVAYAKTINSPANSQCFGPPRDDTIRGDGQNNLFGRGGNDRMISKGTSVVEGGSGDDVIKAKVDANVIVGGPGDDVIFAAHDGPSGDEIDCGPGQDRVVFDKGLDSVKRCEDKSPR